MFSVCHLLMQLPGIGQPVKDEVHAARHNIAELRLWDVCVLHSLHEAHGLLLSPAVGSLCSLVLSSFGICCARLQQQ